MRFASVMALVPDFSGLSGCVENDATFGRSEHAVDPMLADLARDGALVLLGDPGRTYLPRSGLERVTAYGVKTSRALEDTDLRNAVVWRITGVTT